MAGLWPRSTRTANYSLIRQPAICRDSSDRPPFSALLTVIVNNFVVNTRLKDFEVFFCKNVIFSSVYNMEL